MFKDDINTERQRKLIFAVLSFFLPLITYIRFLCPTIATGDTGELINASFCLGVPHPPGYPLFTILGKLFTFIPINSIAWRVNFSSSIFDSFCCLFVYLSLYRVTRNPISSILGSLTLAFSKYFWHYSEVAEVFPLNNLFISILIYILISWKDNESPEKQKTAIDPFYIFSFVFGLSLTNHHTILMFVPAFFYFIFANRDILFRRKKNYFFSLLLFIIGLLPYLYLPFAASMRPYINWDNPVNLTNFIKTITRHDYGSLSLMSKELKLETPPLYTQLPFYFISLYNQFGFISLTMGIYGFLRVYPLKDWIMRLYSKKPKKGMKRSQKKEPFSFDMFLLIAFIFSGPVFLLIANAPINNPLYAGVLHRFLIMSAIIFSYWIGLGADHFFIAIEKSKSNEFMQKTIIYMTVILCISSLCISNRKEADFSNNYVSYDLGRNLLSSLPPNSIFFVIGDAASMAVDYLQLVEKFRTDVKVIDQEKLTCDWFAEQVKERFPGVTIGNNRYDGVKLLNINIIESNIDKFPLFFSSFKEKSYKEKYTDFFHGTIREIALKDKNFDEFQNAKENEKLLQTFSLRGITGDFPETSFEFEVKKQYSNIPFEIGYVYEQNNDLEKAEYYYKKSIEFCDSFAPPHKNLGVLYLYKKNDKKKAIEEFKKYLKLAPDDKEKNNIIKIIKDNPI